jgi:uncharacterized membrane protein
MATVAETHSKISVPGNTGVKIIKSCTINRRPEELYQFWRHFENLPRFTKHLVSVTEKSEKESHWVAKAPGGPAEWDAEIINEHPNSLIAWRSKPGTEVPNAGSVRFEFAPGGQGTEVTISLEYRPPVGALGRFVAKLHGEEPERQVEEDLRRFKALMEIGEIPTTEGQPVGPRKGRR